MADPILRFVSPFPQKLSGYEPIELFRGVTEGLRVFALSLACTPVSALASTKIGVFVRIRVLAYRGGQAQCAVDSTLTPFYFPSITEFVCTAGNLAVIASLSGNVTDADATYQGVNAILHLRGDPL